MYVTDNESLKRVANEIRNAELLALDTEFMREKTYYARLCLIQVSTGEVTALIDPLTVDDLCPLFDVLHDPAVLKVVHAGGQDLEILYRIAGRTVAPVFDTQVAATLAGFPQQVGYGALVRDLLGVELDKSDTYTDWGRRPLTDAQLRYAEADVRHLPALYERLSADLESSGRMAWLADEFAGLAEETAYEVVPEEQWRRVKRVAGLNRRQLSVAREVAAWRETEAQRRDIPKRWVLGDEAIVEIARRAPRDADTLRAIRGVSDKLPRSANSDVLEAVGRGLETPEEELPSLPKRPRISSDVDGAVDLMVALVRLRAKEHGVATPLLASRDDLARLAAGVREESPLLEGWRRGIVGEELLELLEGRIALRWDGGELRVERNR